MIHLGSVSVEMHDGYTVMHTSTPALIDADVAQHMCAQFVSQCLFKFVDHNWWLAIVRRPARNAEKLKAECNPYKGQRKYGRFHQSLQRQE